MDDGSQLLLLVIIAFVLMAAYFAIAETSFASVSRVRIKTAEERGNKRASKALKVLDDFDYAVTTILIGTNITHLGIASIVTVLVIRKWGPSLVSVSTIITTIAVFFLSEMLPKSIAKRYSEPLALFTAGSLLVFMKLFRPVSFVLTAIGQWAARLFGQTEEVTVTEEELHDIIEDMADDGMLGEEQSELISSALDFGDITVDSIMTPRSKMDFVSISTEADDMVQFLLGHEHSRYPVYEGSEDNIIGTLRMQKYLRVRQKEKAPDLRQLIDQPGFVRGSVPVDELINELNRRKVSIAIVQDENGLTSGVVTIADALEALVGDIWGGVEA